MLRVFLLSSILVLCARLTFCYGLGWKQLHEEADRTTLEGALGSLKADPGSLEKLYVLGLVYLNLHRDKEAGEAFSKMLSIKPGVAEASWGLAEVERRAHRLKESRVLASGVIRREPGFSPAQITLAYIDYIEMDFKSSVNLAYKVIAQGREKVDLSNYVRAYLLVGGGRGMLAHYGGPISKIANGTAVLYNLKKAYALQPDSAGVCFGLGSFYFLAPALAGGDKLKAREYLERAIKLDPLFADACVRLAQYYKGIGDDAAFELYMKKASAIDPKNELLLDTESHSCRFLCGGGG